MDLRWIGGLGVWVFAWSMVWPHLTHAQDSTAADVDHATTAASDTTHAAAKPFAARFFVDASFVSIVRTVNFNDSPNRSSGSGDPHGEFGIGIFFTNGFHDLLGHDLGNLLDKFGARLSVLIGENAFFDLFPPSLDINNTNEQAYRVSSFNFNTFGDYESRGRGLSLILTTWQVLNRTDRATEFRQTAIASNERIVQEVAMFGASVPFLLKDDLQFGIENVRSFFGVLVRYEFLEAKLTAQNPPTHGTVSNHALLLGVYLDWGIAEFVRLDISVELGAILNSPSGFVSHVNGALYFAHKPPFLADDHLEIIGRIEINTATLDLRSRYLHDPAQPANSNNDAITWINLRFIIGVRAWF